MQGVYKSIEEYNPSRKCNVFMVFNGMIADMISKKKINQIVTEPFIRGRKIDIFTIFITKSHFPVPKDVQLNCTRLFIMKITDN